MNKLMLLLSLLTFSLGSFSQGQMTSYSGTIKNYNIELGFSTGSLAIHNAVTGADAVHLIKVATDGTFSIEFALMRNQSGWLRFPFSAGHVYFEPGTKVFHEFELTDSSINSNFKGDLASLNNDIWKASIATKQIAGLETEVDSFTPYQYKQYVLTKKIRRLKALDSVKKASGLSKIAYSRTKDEINLESAISLMGYSHAMETAFRLKGSISFASRTPLLLATKLDASYYDFLRDIKYNDSYNMSLPSYRIFLVRLQEIDPIYTSVLHKAKTQVNLALKKEKRPFTDKEIQDNIDLASKNSYLLTATRPEVLKNITKSNVSLEIDLMNIQEVCNTLKYYQKPLSDSALLALKSGLKHPHFINEVIALNDQVKKKIEESRIAIGAVTNETPKGAADSLVDNILKKYKGKTVFIDFWATWCGPCLMAIENLASIKADLVGSNVVFLYLTNTTSPEKTYNVLAPGIKGEHYRLTTTEYDLISAKLGIVGFPHYAIANKDGIIIERDYKWNDPDNVKQKLTELASEGK
jgi:thiol-disulfide isomerase/thioredoxin